MLCKTYFNGKGRHKDGQKGQNYDFKVHLKRDKYHLKKYP